MSTRVSFLQIINCKGEITMRNTEHVTGNR